MAVLVRRVEHVECYFAGDPRLRQVMLVEVWSEQASYPYSAYLVRPLSWCREHVQIYIARDQDPHALS